MDRDDLMKDLRVSYGIEDEAELTRILTEELEDVRLTELTGMNKEAREIHENREKNLKIILRDDY